MPHRSLPAFVQVTVWFAPPPADGSVPPAMLSDPELGEVSLVNRRMFGDVAENAALAPLLIAETIRPPVVVPFTVALTVPVPLAVFVTGVPSVPAPVTVIEPAPWLLGASENATETVLLPVGQEAPVSP